MRILILILGKFLLKAYRVSLHLVFGSGHWPHSRKGNSQSDTDFLFPNYDLEIFQLTLIVITSGINTIYANLIGYFYL